MTPKREGNTEDSPFSEDKRNPPLEEDTPFLVEGGQEERGVDFLAGLPTIAYYCQLETSIDWDHSLGNLYPLVCLGN